MLAIGVLGSGNGSNFQAILDAIDSGALAARVTGVFSDNAEAFILERARLRGIAAEIIDGGTFRSRLPEPEEQRLAERLLEVGTDLVVLAGFMRLIRQPLLDAFPGRIINIHPSLLPRHPGLASWKQALDAGDSVAGCTVHLVDAGMDTGEILAQSEVPILPGDTPETLHARIQEAEHHLLPHVIATRFAHHV